MDRQQAYVEALESTIRALDAAFLRANAAETLALTHPNSQRWPLSEEERTRLEHADIVAYEVGADHWGARLALMSVFEALHAALRVVACSSAHHGPLAKTWTDAAERAWEAARLAQESARVFEEAAQTPAQPGHRALVFSELG